MKAWLIRWNWAGNHAAVDNPIVTVLSARTNIKDIQAYVEQRYIEATASLDEKLDYARYNDPVEPPYRARRERGVIHCGHNPWLEAKKVDDLKVEVDGEGKEVLKWAKPVPAKARNA